MEKIKIMKNVRQRKIHTHPSTLTEKVKYLKLPAILLISLAFSSATLAGRISPFCASLIASLTGIDCIAAFVGAVIGFLVSGNLVDAIPHMAALLVVLVFRIIAARSYETWINAASSLVCGFTVIIANVFLSEKPSDVVIAVALGISAGVVAYAFSLTQKNLTHVKKFSLMKPANVAALGISYIAVISAFSCFSLEVFNLGVFLGTVATLIANERFRYSGGAIVGALTAIGMAIADNELIAPGLLLIAAGLSTGLFTRLGKVTQAAGMVMVVGIGMAVFGFNTGTLTLATAVLSGGVLYIVLPTKSLLQKVKQTPPQSDGAEISEIFAQRLRLSCGAMSEVRLAVEKTAELLDRKNHRDISWVYNSACGSVCRKCRNNTECWGSEYDDTVKQMTRMMSKMRQGNTLTVDDLGDTIKKRCYKKDRVISAIHTQYKEFLATNSANRKIAEMRSVLTTQLMATEQMIFNMAEEFEDTVNFDRGLAAIIEKILQESGADCVKAAVLNQNGRMYVEAYGEGKLTASDEQLCDKLSSVLRIKFDLPEIEYSEGSFRFIMCEMAIYSIEYGVSQVNSDNEKSCGDYYETFVDNKGYAYVILSDGMGSGSRARIDSAFACGLLVKLLRSGISISSAIDIINNSLSVKSSDESFATLDICKIDLYNGNVELYKAGSAPTFIRCNKKMIKASGKGLPIGITRQPSYEKQSFAIGASDVIIMTSDGAEINEKWLEHELSVNEGKVDDMAEIAETIAQSARFSSAKGRGDDISVIAVKLVK